MRTLWRSGHGYISCSVDTLNLSPVYVTVTAARSLLRRGVNVRLPDGYTLDALDAVAWLTGAYGHEVAVTERQAREVAEIACTLTDQHADELDPTAREGIAQIIQIVITEGGI